MPEPKSDLVDDALRRSLRADARHVAERLLGQPNKALSSPDESRWGSKGSMSVALRGPKAGTWYDFESGTGGDMIALVQRETGGDFARAAEWARAFTGLAPERQAPSPVRPPPKPPPADPAEQARRANRVEYARRLAGESVPADGTPADRYLRQVRGVPRPDAGWPAAVRWHPGHRALLVVATDGAGAVQSVQRVHLTRDGTKIGDAERGERNLRAVKISNGVFSGVGVAVRLPGRADGPLLVAEGPETGLAVWASTGHETWIALGSAGKIEPPTGRRVVLLGDDNPSREDRRLGVAERGVEKAMAEWQAKGVDVVRALPWPERRHDRSDFADVILRHGPDVVRERIGVAVQSRAPSPSADLTQKGRDMSDASADSFDRAAAFVRAENRATTKSLQDGLGLTFNEASKLMERLEREGVVSAADGINPRRILPVVARPDAPESPAVGRGDIPPVHGRDEGLAVARVIAEAKLPDADPERIRATLAPFDDAARARISDRATWALDRRAEVTGDRASSEVLALALARPSIPDAPKPDTSPAPASLADAARTRAGPADAPLSVDAQTIYQAVSKLLQTYHVIAAEDLKPQVQAMLAAREAADGPVQLTPDIRLAAGKPPVHTLDEMRQVFAAVRERAAVPSDRMSPETAAEVRESLQQQIAGARSMVDLMKLYGQDETQRAIKSLDAHPEQQRLLTDAMEVTGKRLLAEDRAKLGLDEPAARRRDRGVLDVPDAGSKTVPDVSDITISRRGDNGAPAGPERPPERAADPLARDYDIREKGDERHYHRRDDGTLAIRATDTHIHGVRRDAATIGAMLDLAAARGWNDVQIRGDRETARTAWIEATARGLRAEGYTPTRDDRHAVEQRRVERREMGLEAPERLDRAGRGPDRPERGAANDAAATAAERQAAPARSAREERQDRNAWTTTTGGFDALTPRQQQHAERSYTNWSAANPELAEKHGLRDYVGYVQDKQAERRAARDDRGRDRDDERHVPPAHKVHLPSRSMGL